MLSEAAQPKTDMDAAAGSGARWSTALLLLFLSIFYLILALALGIPGHLSSAYVTLHLCTVMLAVLCRSRTRPVRWAAGFACTMALAGFKTAVLMPALSEEIGLGGKMLVYATSALWECSNAALVFGGQALQSGFQISSYRRALIAGLIPCQLKFIDCSQAGRTSQRCVHLGAWFLFGILFREILRTTASQNIIGASPILEAECMAVLVSVAVLVCNLPAILCQIAMDLVLRVLPDESDFRVLVILPYGAILFSTCTRDFWNRWSRPATQLIRQMLYHPLGGSNRPWLSIPVMFAVNATSHYDVSKALVGDRAEWSWNVAFGVLGCAALIETYAVKLLLSSERQHEGGEEPDSVREHGNSRAGLRDDRAPHLQDRSQNYAMDMDSPGSVEDSQDAAGPSRTEAPTGDTVERACGNQQPWPAHYAEENTSRSDRALRGAPRETRLLCFVVTHASLVFALYILVTQCLKMTLQSFL